MNNFFEDDKMHEECGVFGIYSHSEDVALNTYWGLFALQHRGQESCGIAVADGQHMKIKRGMGLVTEVFKDGVENLKGHLAIGHVRYSTTGYSMAFNTQPLKVYFDGGHLALSHNGNIANAGALRKELAADGAIFQTTVDAEVVLSLLARSRKETVEERFAEALNRLKGAFAILIMTQDKIIAARDPFGFRPLCIGKLPTGGWCVASESCAFDLVGAELVRDVKPGELIVIDSDAAEPKSFHWAENMPAKTAHCVFEYVYIARNDSRIDEQDVYEARIQMGRAFARETAALHTDEVIVDDSIVRGTTSGKVIKLLKDAGAREVHVCISSPPVTDSCYYGIDTSERKELIAARCTHEEICRFIGADSLHYISMEGMKQAIKAINPDGLCVACFNADYPDHADVAAKNEPKSLARK